MIDGLKVITEYDDFISLKNTWNNLLADSESDIIFLRHEWFKCWWDAFGSDKQLFIITLRDRNEIKAIAPLMLISSKYRGLKIKKLCFIQNDNSPRTDLIMADNKSDVIDLLLRYFKQNTHKWDMVTLENIASESSTCGILYEELYKKKYKHGVKTTRNSPYLKIESDWIEYVSRKSSKFRKTMRNKRNRINRLAGFRIEKITDFDSTPDVYDHIIEISKNSWKGRCSGDIARSPENKMFFKKLSLICARNNWLNLWMFYEKSGKPAAYEYHLLYKNRTYAMRSDYDEKYSYYSPGCVLEMSIIEDAFDNKLMEYDFCGNFYEYKLKWANSIREHLTYELFGFNTFSKLLYKFEYNALPAARKIRNRIKNKKNENL